MSIHVPGYGCSSAKLVLVGEAPGRHEEDAGRPFVGPSGDLVDEVLHFAGISRDEVYMTNVCKVRPPDNKIEKLSMIGHSIEEFLPQLWLELETLNPNCILAFGNTALEALTGFRGIEKYRGSIMKCSKTGHKVIPTLHPASLIHQSGESMSSWKELWYIKHDARRAVEQSLFPQLRLPDRMLTIAHNSLDVIRFFERYPHEDRAMLDVETFKTFPICIGLAKSRHEAISIPIFDDQIPPHDLAYIWKMLADYLRCPRNKIGAQNSKFDEKRCKQVGLKWHDCWIDMAMGWHVLYSEFPKSLQFICSILTEEPYYKDEGREYNPKKDKIDRLLLYNAKDAVVEFECMEEILRELREEGLEEFFFERIMPLHRLYSDMEDIGIAIDLEIRKSLHKKYSDMREERKRGLIKKIVEYSKCSEDNTFGIIKNGKVRQVRVGDFNCDSPEQVGAMLYGYLNCPLRKDTTEATLKALSNNAVKDTTRKEIIVGVLEDRKLGKTIGTYLEAKPSEDNRIHTTFNINGAESGRTSTSSLKPPVSIHKEGIALQTMTKHEDVTLDVGGGDLRSMFIALAPAYIKQLEVIDLNDYVFIEPDLSQAEDRVVCVLSKDFDALRDMERKNFNYNSHGLKDDRHTKTAIMVCDVRFEDVTDFVRQIGKRTRHAGNYDMGKHQGMITFAKYGIFMSEWKVGKLLDKFHATNPAIRGVFHEDVKQALIDNNSTLVSPHGRRRIFFNRWGEELWKEAYAQIPQATVSDQLKWAMVALKRMLNPLLFMFLLECHDSFLALCHRDFVKDVVPLVRQELERPIDFNRCTLSRDYQLVIPSDIKVGRRWVEKSTAFPDGMEKYKE